MVGDGINDTPALRRGLAGRGHGRRRQRQALESADVVLMADALEQLPFAIRLGRSALATIRQNIVLSLSLKAAFLALAFTGGVSLWPPYRRRRHDPGRHAQRHASVARPLNAALPPAQTCGSSAIARSISACGYS